MRFNFIKWYINFTKLLLNIGNCIVNEAMLTGEAVPIIKVSLPYNDKKYNSIDDNKNSTLFCGT